MEYRNFKEEQKLMKITKRKVELVKLISNIVHSTDNVLDVGCGDGFITACLSNYCRIAGGDLDTEYTKARFPSLELHNVDITKEGYGDKLCDVVLCLDVLEHIEEDKHRQVVDMLKKATIRLLIINVPDKDINLVKLHGLMKTGESRQWLTEDGRYNTWLWKRV